MSASAELQKAIFETLRDDEDVGALAGDRIYDGPEPGAELPYITFGPSDYVEDDSAGIIARIVSLQIDCWAGTNGRLRPALEMADAVKAALHKVDLSLPTYAVPLIVFNSVRAFVDADGVTGHGVVTIEAHVEEAYP